MKLLAKFFVGTDKSIESPCIISQDQIEALDLAAVINPVTADCQEQPLRWLRRNALRSEQSCQNGEGLPQSPRYKCTGIEILSRRNQVQTSLFTSTWRKREVRYFEHKHPGFFF